MRRGGFTLLELLVVIAVIGILLSAALPAYLRWVAQNEVRDAAGTLAQEVARLRTQVKRSGGSRTLTVANGATSLTSNRTVPLTNARASGTLNLTFVPPYGTLQEGTATPLQLTLVSTRRSSVTRTVSVVSLFGRVVIQ